MFLLALAISTLSLHWGGPWLFGLWLAMDFLLLGLAHARGWNRIFGKRADGTLSIWSWLVYGPLLLFSHAVWHVLRNVSREPVVQEVAPQMSAGRRLLGHELPGPFDNLVDLTSEFAEPSQLRQLAGYVSFPMLDGAAVDPQDLLAVIRRLRPGTTFVHCAQGHGRTGLFCAALLLERHLAANPAAALEQLQSVRPGIRLSRHQRSCLDRFALLLEPE
jgi:protein-tyrosine phosphatase